MKREVDTRLYLPEVVRDVREYRQLAETESTELTQAWDCQDEALQNQFLFESTEYGVKRWEQMLDIIPEAGESLDDRKSRIYIQTNSRLPYSWRMLGERLDQLCGEDGYTKEMCPSQYQVHVDLAEYNRELSKLVYAILEQMIPANQVWTISVTFPNTAQTANTFRAVALLLHHAASNWGRTPVRFNGTHRFDGSIKFNQQVGGRQQLARLIVRSAAQTGQNLQTGEIFHHAVRLSPSFYPVGFTAHGTAGNIPPALLLERLLVQSIVQGKQAVIANLFFHPDIAGNRMGSDTAFRLQSSAAGKQHHQLSGIARCSTSNPRSGSASFTRRKLHQFNGKIQFNGAKRFDAGKTIQEEL